MDHAGSAMITHLHRPRFQRSGRFPRRPVTRRQRAAPPRPILPEDAALYVCGCGNAFTAAVTASVTCPSCGDGQAWEL
jgi:hypothetical protein